MDPLLFLRRAASFQSMERERVETVRRRQPGASSRLWSAGGDCVHRQEFAPFQLGLTMFGPLEAYLNGDH